MNIWICGCYYLSYTLLKNIKNVVIANKYIRKGGNHEDKERS